MTTIETLRSQQLQDLQLDLETALRSQCRAALSAAIERLCELLRQAEPDAETAAGCEFSLLRIRSLATRAAGVLEQQTAREWLSQPCSYFHRVSEWTRREAEMAGVGPASRVLFVGSGAMPVSAIALRAQTGAQVACLDCELVACQLCAQVVERLALDVDVIWGRPERVPVGSYTHVWIASLVPDKERLLRSLAGRLSRASRLVVRHAEGWRRMFNYALDLEQCGEYRCLSRLSAGGHLHDSSLLQLQ